MKKIIVFFCLAIILFACNNSNNELIQRAAELCNYVPDHELLKQSQDFMTSDFYAVLDTMFNYIPEDYVMDYDYIFYFVTGNGGAKPIFEVSSVEQTDDNHAVATVLVSQAWDDGTIDKSTEKTEHKLYMERVNDEWLLSDFDNKKAECIIDIANIRRELSISNAINEYLINEIGYLYSKGEYCIPAFSITATEETGDSDTYVWGDFWIFWYNAAGDTLKTISGGNHPGKLTLQKQNNAYKVTGFEQTTDGAGYEESAKRIFGNYYDVYQNIHSYNGAQDFVRKNQLKEYLRRNNLSFRCYQDFGWPAVEI